MITEYHRPKSLKQAISLLSKPDTYPLGGGTLLSHQSDKSFAVVDLQALGLNKIHKVGDKLEIGATATLSLLLESPHIPPALATTLRLETPLNIRNSGTVAGTLVTSDGRSPFATAMLALDAKLIFAPGDGAMTFGDFLPLRTRTGSLPPSPPGKLIIKIEIPLNTNLAFKTVARTPTDRPIVCTAVAQWPSGRTRLALGGWGKSSLLAMDGNNPGGLDAAARNAACDSTDEWASANYRCEVAAVLVKRCIDSITNSEPHG